LGIGEPHEKALRRSLFDTVLELAPVIANLAADAGLACRRCKDTAISNEEARQGKLGSEWVVLVRDVQRLGSLAQAPTWDQLPTEARVGLWTDDFSNILTVLNWFRRA
jgi:hypothetical protein